VAGLRKIILLMVIIVGIFSTKDMVFGEVLTPVATVINFYTALQNGHFEQAYGYLSSKMKGNKTKEQWAVDTKNLFESGEVVILEFKVSPAKVEGDKAMVQVWNRSKDMLNPEGLVEYETDHLTQENGVWKIDETVVSTEK
jgi:hypothetical protein